ncbi:ROK family protein [Paenibacillus glycanilyticus]|uniref:fructokinase n=1 Tax=Paenibacillus glycanilyticus TaxID=126569 RepID=A0ABQ6GHV2_9BACL|nr:ROK family protein [Paenibacillus glycanilyticus]GLX68898.1 putative fructokinase [Paenibacillus glycanilyticus]
MLLGAIEGGGTKFVCGIGTIDGEIIERISIPTTTPEVTMDQAMSFFSNKGIVAIGVGTFGPIDINPLSPAFGSVTSTPKPYWSGYRILDHIKQRMDIPVGFDTDVNAAALGESVWGAAAGLRNCLYMTVGTGIGVGAIVEGNLVHGLMHPEMGHIVVNRHPMDSYAGNCPYHGDCLEGMASGPAVEKRWNTKAMLLGDSHTAWELESFYIGQALANYILVLSPEIIILGGGIMNQKHLFPLIREQVKKRLNGYVDHPVFASDLETYIVPPSLGGSAGLCGALALAKKALMK